MTKILFTSIFFASFLVGASINWSNNYHMGRQLAKKTNKNVVFFVTTRKDNPSCNYMEEDIFTNKKIIDLISKNFIAIKMYVEDGGLPGGRKFFAAPSIYILKANGKKLHQRITGEVSINQMQKILESIR